MLLYLAASGVLLTGLRRPLGRYTVIEQRLEGEFRFVNSRLITNSEEVAFYQGNEREALVISETFGRLERHLRKSMQFRFSMGIIDNLVAKYFATIVGFYVVSRPFLELDHPRHLHSTHSEIMEDYYQSGRMLVNLATAVGRLVLAGRELTRLAGFTARVSELMDVLQDLGQGKYTRTMVKKDATNSSSTDDEVALAELKPNAGKIIEVDHLIHFDNVPLVTPNGDVLVRSLSFEVRSGMNVLVCGPNGCGKSRYDSVSVNNESTEFSFSLTLSFFLLVCLWCDSLFRILGELWPLFGGTLRKPKREKLFYIPQRPYMTLGTLRDQIIYPQSRDEMLKAGRTDEGLSHLLDQVY